MFPPTKGRSVPCIADHATSPAAGASHRHMRNCTPCGVVGGRGLGGF